MASLDATARGILLAASGARHNLEPDQVDALNDLLAPTGTTLDALLSEQQPHYTDPAFVDALCGLRSAPLTRAPHNAPLSNTTRLEGREAK